MTDNDKQRIDLAISECGNGNTVREGFSPLTDLLRDFAKEKNVSAFAAACQTMFSGSIPNQWSVKDDAPKILRNAYLAAALPPAFLSHPILFDNAQSWDEQLRIMLHDPNGLRQALDRMVEEVKNVQSSDNAQC